MDKALTSLAAASSLSLDDIFYVVDDPSGSPVSKKVSLATLQKALNLAKSNVFNAAMAELPASNYATFSTRNNHPILQFDDTTQWAAYFRGIVPYTADLTQGCTIYIKSTAVATSGTVGWDVSFERDAALDLDADSFDTPQTVTATSVNATSGIYTTRSVTFTQAQLPTSLAVGDMYRLRIRRDVANDNAVGNAQLLQVEVRWV